MKIRAVIMVDFDVDTDVPATAMGIAGERLMDLLREEAETLFPKAEFSVHQESGPTSVELERAVADSAQLAYPTTLKTGQKVGMIHLIKVVRDSRKVDLIKAKALVDEWREKGVI